VPYAQIHGWVWHLHFLLLFVSRKENPKRKRSLSNRGPLQVSSNANLCYHAVLFVCANPDLQINHGLNALTNWIQSYLECDRCEIFLFFDAALFLRKLDRKCHAMHEISCSQRYKIQVLRARIYLLPTCNNLSALYRGSLSLVHDGVFYSARRDKQLH